MDPYGTILFGSLLLSAVHAAIPNHWAPLVMLGKTEKWTARQFAAYTAITGVAHTASTVLVGIVVGSVRYRSCNNPDRGATVRKESGR
jgi:nickel/cobalt exporter